MIRVLELIDEWGVYAYVPADDLPLVALLDDDARTALPVPSVRAVLTRGLVVVRGDEFTRHLVLTDAGYAAINAHAEASK